MTTQKHRILTEDRRVQMAHAGYAALFLALGITFLLALRDAQASGAVSLLFTAF
jgi:hypothetical protein